VVQLEQFVDNSGQRGNLFSRATRLLGRVLQHFGRALTVVAGTASVWPQILACTQASSGLPGWFLAKVCSILMVEKHKMAACL